MSDAINQAGRIAYLDLPSGISGDIFLGCLVDAGWPVEELVAVIEQMPLAQTEWHIRAEPVMRGPLRATLVHVDAQEGHVHRHLGDVREIIEGSNVPARVKEQAIAVFTRLARAEATVHGSSLEDVHFHEVGAVDAIIDIVGVVAGLHALGIERLYASGVPLGHGWTRSAHGRIPLPAPATLALLTEAHAPNRPAPGPGELVTPTGAALLAELAEFTQPPLVLERIGLGAGQKEFEWPNIARLWLARPQTPLVPRSAWNASAGAPRPVRDADRSTKNSLHHETELVQLETNIDDMNPELYSTASDRLFAAGALDVWTTPIGMKKSRPGTLLSVLARAEDEATMADILLRETTTLGVRVHAVHRHMAEREFHRIETQYGAVQVKLKRIHGQIQGIKPEFDDCQRLAAEHGVPARLVQEAAQASAFALMNE